MSEEDDDIGNGTQGVSPTTERGGVIRLGKTDYAVGLLWSRAEDVKRLSFEAKTEANEYGADLVAYKKDSQQYALGKKTDGLKPGMPSLAAALSESIDGSFLGIFKIPETSSYYICAVQNGNILAGQDRIIEEREQALDDFGLLSTQGNWEFVFAPADFGFERTQNRPLEEVLDAKKAKVKLAEISPKNSLLKIGLVLIGAAVIYLAYGQYSAWQEAALQERLMREAAEAEAARLAEEQARLDALARQRVELPTFPWEGRASFDAQLRRCVSAILKDSPTVVPGWRPVNATCNDEGEVRLSFQRDGGTINWIAPFVNREGFRPRIIADSSAGTVTNVNVVWSINMDGLPRFVADSPTTTLSEARRYISAWSEEKFLTSRLTDVPGVMVEIAGPNNQPQNEPVSRGLQFSYTISANPEDLLTFLSQIPVTVLERVSLDMSNSRNWTWNVEGVTHERIPLPPDARPVVRQNSGVLGIPGR
jgi:hypothetical protein